MEAFQKEKVSEETSVQRRTALFNQYVAPHQNLIYKLCIQYSFSQGSIPDNYVEALTNFFKYIETYDPSRSIQTWLHIVTKRLIADINTRQQLKMTDDVDVQDMGEWIPDDDHSQTNCMGMDNYREFYNDEILRALDQLKPIYRETLLLQQAGYKLNEIMDICFRRGTLKSKNIETVKSRLFLAKQQMRNLITRDGETKRC